MSYLDWLFVALLAAFLFGLCAVHIVGYWLLSNLSDEEDA